VRAAAFHLCHKVQASRAKVHKEDLLIRGSP
jgi:hypothetical protein